MNQLDPQTVVDEGIVSTNEETVRDDGHETLGQRLCAAREARGWSRADVAARLKLPLSLIGRLETDDYEGLTEGVFLRGYLGSYARLVGLSVEQAASVAAANSRLAPLVATGTVSRSRYLFERYSVSATYLILTAIIVVPAVWLATHGGLEQNLARTTPLDPAPAALALPGQDAIPAAGMPAPGATSESTASVSTQVPVEIAPPPAAPVASEQAPVIASMTPFTATAPAAAPSATPAEPPKPAAESGSGEHSVTLKLSQASWVEILGDNGQRLEYATLAAGTERSYRSDGTLSVRLGNAQGAELRSDGKLVELAPFQRGNVAHLKLSSGGSASRAE